MQYLDEDRTDFLKKMFSFWRLLGVFCAVAAISFCGWGIWLWSYAVSPSPVVTEKSVLVYIPPKTSFFGIQKILVQNKVIIQDRRFYTLARYFKLTNKLKAGEYLFEPGQAPRQVLRALEQGSALRWPVTIPEGTNIYQLADILAQYDWVDRERLLSLVMDVETVKGFGFRGMTLEGYLFPETYNLMRGQSEKEIVSMLVAHGKEVRKAIGDLSDNELKLSPHQVLTLASIVEKETAVPTERPLIARVFLNRLKRNMRLQTDPTVIYGLSNFDGNLTRKHLKTPTPYNTYIIRGLPPGPIANPGRAAIEAVLKPAKGKYLYFVSKNDGSHYFSTSLKEHNRAVYKFQKLRKYR